MDSVPRFTGEGDRQGHHGQLRGPEGEGEGDVEVEDLTRAMSSMESSLSFLPRGVRKTKSARERGRGGGGGSVTLGGLGLDV